MSAGCGPRNRPVVIGASLAGLLAGRVLSESFAEVVLLERDERRNIQHRAREHRRPSIRTGCWPAARAFSSNCFPG